MQKSMYIGKVNFQFFISFNDSNNTVLIFPRAWDIYKYL